MADNPRLQLLNILKALPSPLFNELLYVINPPAGLIAGPTAPQAERAVQLLNWAESPPQRGLVIIEDALKQLNNVPDPPDIESLVADVRAQVYADIKERCGKMRVLDMEQPIGLGDIYTSVNILEKISGRRRLGLEDLLQDCDPENFDRFLLGQVRHKRIPGLQAVEEHRQLMILGKPGAGKTTFMKRLAILCNAGDFQPQRVPVFVTLKEYAEDEGKPKLQTFIQNQWTTCGVKEPNALEAILKAGQALVLLDGLDEVQENDHDRVLQDIKIFTQQFRDCECVITCRIAAREYIFEAFTEVEVADFDQKQIAEFATKWFKAKQDPKKAETFIQRLESNKPIQELATNPLLLTLLCLVFGEAADFPANRAELYKEGLDVLLKKWDAKRNIERDQVYKKLSLKRKEDLLSQLAFETFKRGNYFFKQATVEQHIIRYIRNLPGASEDEDALQLDSEVVLKSIEAQHGLLVARASRIYSFSHLTFHEYFTAQHIVSPTTALNQALQNLATHITEKRYREIFFLVAEMLPEADILLLSIKKSTDYLIDKNSSIQDLLKWASEKSRSIKTRYKLAAIRSFYLCIDQSLMEIEAGARFFASAHITSIVSSLDQDFLLYINLSRAFNIDRFRNPEESTAIALTRMNERWEIDLDLFLHRVMSLCLEWLDSDFEFDYSLSFAVEIVTHFTSNSRFLNDLEELISIAPDNINKPDSFWKWWHETRILWGIALRNLVTEHRNIGHNWEFNKDQIENLNQYYEANKLLVDCLNSDCYVTKATRQYIEDTLLLPLSELEKYPVPDAIANL